MKVKSYSRSGMVKGIKTVNLEISTTLSENVHTFQQSCQNCKGQEMGSLCFPLDWDGMRGQLLVRQPLALQQIHTHLHPEGRVAFKTSTIKTYKELKKKQNT